MLGVAASPNGCPGLEKGDPGTAVSEPVLSLEKPEMLFPPALAVKTKALPGVGGGVCTPMVGCPVNSRCSERAQTDDQKHEAEKNCSAKQAQR